MNSLEIRVPFLDLRITEYVNSVTNGNLTKDGKVPKAVLKKIAKNYFSEEFVYRKKLGFPLPLEDWFRVKENPYINILESLQFSRKYISQSKLQKLIAKHLSGENHGRMLWTILI